MFSLYLTPAALGYLTQIILAALTSGYLVVLVHRQPLSRPAHLQWLTAFFLGFTTFVTTLFLDAALLPTPRLYAVALQIPLLACSWICLLQFAYRFPSLPETLRREARWSLLITGLYALWESGYAIFRFIRLSAGIVEFRIDWTDFLLLLCLVWPAIVFVRQMYRLAPKTGRFWTRLTAPWLHPSGRETRALRAFALIFLFVSGLSLFNLLRTFYLLSVALANVGISIGILIALFAFALAYLNQRTETTSFMVKLAGMTLTTTLAILGIVGWAVSPPHIAEYQPDLPARHALRFTPNARGGYDINAIPFNPESDLGHDLHLDDGRRDYGCSAAFDFAFVFYGQTYRAIYACNDGVISLGQPIPYREFQYRYGVGVPLLMPLLMDLDPTISPGGVFARQEADRLVVTWDRLHGFRQPEAEFTFQVILYADGTFDFVYVTVPENLIFQPNDDPGASLWAIGALPGDLHSSKPQITSLTLLPITSGPEGVIEDFRLEFRQHLHLLLAPLAVLILAASISIVGGFPLMFYVSLVQPLNALLRSAERIEAGEYEVTPVQSADEIGFLTSTFNRLVVQVRDLIRDLEARVTERTAELSARSAELDAANVYLRQEMLEHEQAQTALIEQQRILARYEERERLSRELHDGLGQTLGYINVQAQAAQAFLDDRRLEAAQIALDDLIHAAQDAHTDIRAHILGLRARETVPQDFLTAVREFLEQFGKRNHLVTALSAPAGFPQHVFSPTVEEQTTRILQEALTNVRKHAQAHKVEVIFSLIGDQVQMMIADDGIGFEANQQISKSANQQIEQPAISIQYPVSSNRSHFGLSIMRERAEQVGGQLEIRTAPGKGTRLLVTLPRYHNATNNVQNLKGIRLLLADDHPLFLDGLRNMLSARGMTVVGVAHDGYEAQEKARALLPDVIIMDINMPKCNGLEATRAIKTEFPEMKVLVLTTAEDDSLLFEAIKNGASGYLLKNLDADRFCAAVAGLLNGDTPLAPGMATRVLEEYARLALVVPTVTTENDAKLSPQQWEILGLVADGQTYREIAQQLHLSQPTIKYHIGQILEHLQLENRAQAIAYYRQTQMKNEP